MVINMDSENEYSNIKTNIGGSNNNSQDLDDEVFLKEYLRIRKALNNGELYLSNEDQNKLENDLDIISKSLNLDLTDEDHADNQTSDFKENVVSESVDGGVDLGSSDVVSESVDGGVDLGSSESEVNSDIGTLNNGKTEIAIKVNNVTMEYKITKEKIDTIKEFIIRTIKKNKTKSTKLTALKNVSFEIPKGDRVGIIGFNGAGKSTLLKVLSGVYDPTYGSIEIKGKLAPLLELGAGFDPNYSGKANIFLNGAFLGFSEDFLKEKYNEILEFSELGESINYPVKNYSSGMRAKLGFAIATLVNPDILIIDEILSVGDIKFQKKSAEKLRSLIDSGITVLLVSHSVNQIRDICNKAIWIDNGEIKRMGEVNEVCDEYVKAAEEASNDQLKNIKLG